MSSSTAEDVRASARPARTGWLSRAKAIDPLTAIAFLAVVAYAVIGIGSPLLGLKVFAATDLLAGSSPYRDTGLDPTVQNSYLNDTIDSYLPNIALFVSAFYAGQIAAWNPYIIGGTPLGASTNLGLLNPIAWPYFLLPIWLAPGYVKLTEIAVAVAGTFLFCRRIGLGRPAGLIAGLVFASSGFMVAWTNWPHTRVAALIPLLFWALERLVVRRAVADAVLIALITAAMLFGGFPAVAGYGLLFGAAYLVVRVFAEYRSEVRRIIGVGLGAAAAVVAGLMLTAVQVAPFVSYMSSAQMDGRQQSPDDHLLPGTLVTAIAPWAMGSTDPSRPPFWYLYVNLVESLVYVGAAAAVLAVVALAMPRAGRALTARGVWPYFAAATGGLLVVLYVGRFPLAVLQQLPVLFSENFVGRARSVLGFLVAVLAAIGFEALLRRRRAGWLTWRVHWYPVAVWLGAGLVGAVAWWNARRTAYAASARDGISPAERVSQLNHEMFIGVGLVALAIALVATLWWTGGRSLSPAGEAADAGPVPGVDRSSRRIRIARFAAAALLPVLVAGQALTLAVPYWPRVDRATFYPVTDTHRFLIGHLGHERFAGSGHGMYVGADSGHRLRALTGHFFLNKRYAAVIDGLPGRQFGDPPTYVNFPAVKSVVTSPVLDRLAVKYFVASPGVRPLGRMRTADAGTAATTLSPGRPVTVPVPGAGPLRAIGLTPTAAFPTGPETSVDLTLLDASGNPVAKSHRLLYDLAVGKPFWIPVAAESVPDHGALTAQLTLHASRPLQLAGAARGAESPAVSTVRPEADGLRLAYAGSAVVYERLHAVPRIHWASHSRVEKDPKRRVDLVAGGKLAPDEVLLDAADGPAAGGPATVHVTEDGTDEIEVKVAAAGAGHLVVADALQQDWVATVDGRPAKLVPADHGMVAVPVGKGSHTVRLAYRLPYHNLGGWISGLTGLVLIGLISVEGWRRRGWRSGPVTRRATRVHVSYTGNV
jgi:hypothetical protein